MVGGTCAVLHNAIMIGGDWLGFHYVASSLVSFTIVVCVGYWLHSGWTFRTGARSGTSFARYTLVAGANLPAALAGMFLFVDLLGFSVPVASPIVTVLLFVMNFAGNRWALKAKTERA